MPFAEMIALKGKASKPVDFGPAFKAHIENEYGYDPRDYAADISKLQTLSNECRNGAQDEGARQAMLRYIGELSAVESRFPCGENGIRLGFTWTDLYTGKTVTQHSIAYEKACVLFNYAAAMSSIASLQDRASEEGAKRACNGFEASAGAFERLNEAFMHAPTKDMGRDSLTMLIALMTAQAQECYWEKAVRNNERFSTIAQISSRLCSLYDEVHRLLTSISMLDAMKAAWSQMAKAKAVHFRSVMHFYASLSCKKNERYGEQVARNRRALALAQDAMLLVKGLPPGISEALSKNHALVLQKLEVAEKDNDVVYHEAIPALDSLKEIPAMELARPATFPGGAQPTLFARLLPIKALEDVSKFDESVATVVRRMGEAQEAADKELARTLGAMGLPDAIDRAKVADTSMSDDILKAIDATKSGGGAMAFESRLSSIAATAAEALKRLDAVEGAVAELAADDRDVQVSGVEEAAKECADLRAAHAQAAARDAELRRGFGEIRLHVEALSSGAAAVQALMPKRDLLTEGSEEEERAAVALRALVDQANSLASQRHAALADVRRLQQAENVTPHIAFCFNDADAVARIFADQLRKYEAPEKQLKANVAEQAALLNTIATSNASLVEMRKASASKSDRAKVQAAIAASHVRFTRLQALASQGADFYADLAAAIGDVETRVAVLKEGIARRQREREEAERRARDAAAAEARAREESARTAAALAAAMKSLAVSAAPSEIDPDGPRGAAEHFMTHFDALRNERFAASGSAGTQTSFQGEYARLCAEDRAWQASPTGVAAVQGAFESARQFPEKNRYRDICPYENARVRLPDGRYINATSFEGLVVGGPRFIGAQGPLAASVGDFWWMVWHVRCPQIYMLTAEVEGLKVKCHRYWPSDTEPAVHGDIGVACIEPSTPAFGGIAERRVFRMTHLGTGETRDVVQFVHAAWPDHGVPTTLDSLVTLVNEALAAARASPDHPLLVHCSAGVGRTGSFMAMCLVIDALRRGVRVSIPDVIAAMRRNRPSMVQTPLQYELVYRVVALTAEAMCGRQRLPSGSGARMPAIPSHRPPPVPPPEGGAPYVPPQDTLAPPPAQGWQAPAPVPLQPNQPPAQQWGQPPPQQWQPHGAPPNWVAPGVAEGFVPPAQPQFAGGPVGAPGGYYPPQGQYPAQGPYPQYGAPGGYAPPQGSYPPQSGHPVPYAQQPPPAQAPYGQPYNGTGGPVPSGQPVHPQAQGLLD